MAKNWAITIGINQYQYLQPLSYASRDAQLMQDFLCREAGFEKVFVFSDDSPDIGGKSSRPYRATLLRVLRQMFENPFMGAGDNFWFFFSGHGMPHNGRDYLMPMDGDPEDVENTAIEVNCIADRLRRCGADNVVLILDACRKQGTRAGEGIGKQTAEKAKQTGVISFFSCSPNEYSYEIEVLEQGAFTYALLEGLGVQGKCATVERLNHYLAHRVPEINRVHGKRTPQTPYTIVQPITKSHLILLPKYATSVDISTLKMDAYKAKDEGDLELAEQLWIRVLAASLGTDMDAIKVLQKIALLKSQQQFTPTPSESTSQANIKTQINSPEPEKIEVELISAVGVDYTNLRDLLAAGKWKEADQETARIMLKVAKREEEGWLKEENIENFPCQDLRKIDQLWVKNSNGRFGFSVQKRIYQFLGGTREYDEKIWRAFGDHVGWYVKNEWLYYKDLIFTNHARIGHIPIVCGESFESFLNDQFSLSAWWYSYSLSVLVSKLVDCNL